MTETAIAVSEVSDIPLDDISIEELEAMMDGEVQPDEVDEAPVEIEESDEEIAADLASLDDEISDAELLAIIEDVDAPDEEAVEPTEEELLEAVSSAEDDEAMRDAYNSQEAEESESSPTAEAKEPKKKREPRKTIYTNKRSEVASDRSDSDFYLLENDDLALDEEGKKAKHEEVAAMIDGMNVKVGASCVNFLSSLNGKAKMSLFTEITFRFVSRDDAEPIKAADLRAHFMDAEANGQKAYSKGTATPKATNGLKMLLSLKVLTTDGKGNYKINADSILLEKAKAVLAIA